MLAACPRLLTTGNTDLPGPADICRLASLQEEYHPPPLPMQPEDLAYIIFTSGSTGVPKGVEISASAINQHVQAMQQIYDLTPEDRVAQTSDLSFDIALSNLLTAWNAGALLAYRSPESAMAPASFISCYQITFWFSVPSIIPLLQSLGLLVAGAFPVFAIRFLPASR